MNTLKKTEFNDNIPINIVLKVIQKIEKDRNLNLSDYAKSKGGIYSLNSLDGVFEIHDNNLMVVKMADERLLAFRLDEIDLFPTRVALHEPDGDDMVFYNFENNELTSTNRDYIELLKNTLDHVNDKMNGVTSPAYRAEEPILSTMTTVFDENVATNIVLKVLKKIEADKGLNIFNYSSANKGAYSLTSSDGSLEIHDDNLMIINSEKDTFVAIRLNETDLFPQRVAFHDKEGDPLAYYCFKDHEFTSTSPGNIYKLKNALDKISNDMNKPMPRIRPSGNKP
jgi:hypothetical protein